MKNTLLLLLFLGFAFTTAAQDTNIDLGAKFGLNISNISKDPNLVEESAEVGTEFGVFARIGNRFYVQPGVDFVNNKVTIQRTVQPRSGESDEVRFRYFRAPVLLGWESDYKKRSGGSMPFRIMVGPSFAYNIGVSDNNLDVRRRNVRNAQFALHGGVGIKLLRLIELDLMYTHGLTTVFNDSGADGKFRNFSLTVGFSI
ncbi:porin family protein [Pontibacter ramchanderi]|uniref:Outer membrane protein with beta-barrel domain n=1 Tax=Pontibacter ramchanderi TaxID=1179743 RepID=A0A2N3UAD9_9BACT|nr:porin family protein [Pontibacter ramchanderi]PKV66323.1 outer membrane protein with beta-barrel domain [Pontibacter ramchanderi]